MTAFVNRKINGPQMRKQYKQYNLFFGGDNTVPVILCFRRDIILSSWLVVRPIRAPQLH